ncbi:MAG: Holliday junction branch migration protein RuvA [Bifidobacteriaceae bacterium]|nr:Holliday junction branch migration protein RuvA [Bifidobacteriaceae bacterium]
MIASLNGLVVELGLNTAVIECGGVGYLVNLTPAARQQLRPGEPGRLLTTLVVREDAFTLYGFADDDEREVFAKAQTVAGMGPKLVMALLSAMTPEALRRAVAAEDAKALTRVPGIGGKMAARLVLELAGKLGEPDAEPGEVVAAGGPSAGQLAQQVTAALEGLGWNKAQAAGAVDTVLAADDAPTEVGAVLRAALKTLGAARG